MNRGELREYHRRLELREARRAEVERAAGWHRPASEGRERCRTDADEATFAAEFTISSGGPA